MITTYASLAQLGQTRNLTKGVMDALFVLFSPQLTPRSRVLLFKVSKVPLCLPLRDYTSWRFRGSYLAGFASDVHAGMTLRIRREHWSLGKVRRFLLTGTETSTLKPKKKGIEYRSTPDVLRTRWTVDTNESFEILCKKSPTLTTKVPRIGLAGM